MTDARWHRRPAGQISLVLFVSLVGAAALLPLRSPRVAPEHSAVTLAVLPLANQSPGQVQPFYADGIAAEIADRLTPFADLGVAGARSSLALADSTTDIRTAGSRLGVNRVLQGSVQGMGNRLQLSLQLFDADNGVQLWANDYEARYDTLFDTEDKIARDVSLALQLKPVLGRSRSTLTGTTNLEAHELFLQAQQLQREGTTRSLTQALGLYHEIVVIDRDFALAWAAQFDAFHQSLQELPDLASAARKEMAEASGQLQVLAPAAPATFTTLARLHATDHRWQDAEDAVRHAVSVASPWQADVALANGTLALALGRANDALTPLKLARDADRLNPETNNAYQLALAIQGRDATQASVLPAGVDSNAGATDIIDRLQQLAGQPGSDLSALWFPYGNHVRNDPRFKQILRDLQLPEYFRSSGRWNDFCRPVGNDDFTCD